MILENLDRKERKSILSQIESSNEFKKFRMFRDYYNGVHFTNMESVVKDYGKKRGLYNYYTRSGTPIYDETLNEEKLLVKSNWCRPIIETIADYTRGINEDIIVNGSEELQEIWKENQINILFHEVACDAGIYGKTYLRIGKVKNEEKEKIKIFGISPDNIKEYFNPITGERESVIYFFKISAKEIVKEYPDLKVEKDGFVYYCEEWDNENLLIYVDGFPVNREKDINPYDLIPFVEVKANIYSTSDIDDVIALNDNLNINLTYIAEIIKYQAFPLLAPNATYDQNFIPIDEKYLKNIEISPRTLLSVPVVRVQSGEISQGLLDNIEKTKTDISIVSGVPIKLLTAEIDGSMSGVAIRRMMSSVIKQAEVRRSYLNEAFKEASKTIIKILEIPEEKDLSITFPEIVAVDLESKLKEAEMKDDLGISKQTILEELGYNYKEENKLRQSETDNYLNRINEEQNSIQKNNQSEPERGTNIEQGNNAKFNNNFGRNKQEDNR